ncbi:hypothetical protein [Piscirickettsia salmonis]|uniref:hypothetical protein n=1 Tax=Piscirickettsia salmonis TaxID=1238 RepID=UPI0012B86A84|nr:hypothetical protein [Piscirickettsia salmonis]
MLGDFASLDVQNTYRGSDAYEIKPHLLVKRQRNLLSVIKRSLIMPTLVYY